VKVERLTVAEKMRCRSIDKNGLALYFKPHFAVLAIHKIALFTGNPIYFTVIH
jgi:hypothetical protein